MARAFISIGSNIEPSKNVREALRLLNRRVRVLRISTVYLTEPVDRPGQPPYYNCVVEIDTDILPSELKNRILKGIEEKLGRTRGQDKYASRTIDLDLIIYGDITVEEDELTLPDPQIANRPFLAIPLHEIEPDLILPGSNKHMEDIIEQIPTASMKPLVSFTKQLRKECQQSWRNRHDK